MNKKKLLNSGLLIILPNVFNVIFYNSLPEAFSFKVFTNGIPSFILIGENIGRIGIFLLPFLFIFRVKNNMKALMLYFAGMGLYFCSWFALIYLPDSLWCNSLIGFSAPAYTPIIWLLGIAFLTTECYWKRIKYRPVILITASILFSVFHISHTVLVYIANY